LFTNFVVFYTSDDEWPANAHWKYRVNVADTGPMTEKVFLLSTFSLKNLAGVHGFKGSEVQRFHSHPWTAFGRRIYEKSLSFVRPNPKFRAKLATIWENEPF